MANDVAAGKAEKFESMLQDVLYDSYIGSYIANNQFKWAFNWNDTVHFARFDKLTISDLATSYSSITVQDVNLTDETFVLDIRKAGSFEISDEDYIEMNVSPDADLITSLRDAYANLYDVEIMKEYANAWYEVDDGDLAAATNWGSGHSATLTNLNVYDLVTAIVQTMDENNIPSNDRWLVVSPKEKRLLSKAPELLRSTELWDKVVTWGFMGDIDWVKIWYSNNIQTVTTVKHLIAWQGKPICFAANIEPKIQFVTSDKKADKFTTTVKSQTKFGVKTFTEWAIKLIDVLVTA